MLPTLDVAGLALPGGRERSVFPHGRRLGGRADQAAEASARRSVAGGPDASVAQHPDSPRSRFPGRERCVAAIRSREVVGVQREPKWRLLGQHGSRSIRGEPKSGARQVSALQEPQPREDRRRDYVLFCIEIGRICHL